MGDDHYFDARADENKRKPVTRYTVGRGHIWLCGEDDIDHAFLGTFVVPPLVVTCKTGHLNLRQETTGWIRNKCGAKKKELI